MGVLFTYLLTLLVKYDSVVANVNPMMFSICRFGVMLGSLLCLYLTKSIPTNNHIGTTTQCHDSSMDPIFGLDPTRLSLIGIRLNVSRDVLLKI